MKKLLILSLLTLFTASIAAGGDEARFPKPEFESAYQQPETTVPMEHRDLKGYIALAALVLSMLAVTFFVLVWRSRIGILVVLVLSLLYFGFYRAGCICVVGSLQNMVLAVSDSGYGVSLVLVFFFTLPLLFALFFGRVFCGAACPLGAIQDVLVVKPLRLPAALDHCLGMFPYIYLGLAVLFAATGSAFVICRYDPFVAFFRLDGSYTMLVTGMVFLIVGAFIARPYCRFLCPYGVLLRWASLFSKYHLSITPSDCIQCKLCEDACPFGAINKPFPEKLPESRETGRKRLGIIILVTPVLMLSLGFAFSRLDNLFSQIHPTVELAEQILAEDTGKTRETTWRSRTFRETGTAEEEMYRAALAVRKQFAVGGWILGALLGLALTMKLLSLSIRPQRSDYEADRMKCFSCGRCFSYCPKE